MKNLLRGAVVVVIVMIVLIAVNMACNLKGINLDVPTGTTSAVCAMLLYEGLTKKEKSK